MGTLYRYMLIFNVIMAFITCIQSAIERGMKFLTPDVGFSIVIGIVCCYWWMQCKEND